jgi:hypothetical protein
MALGVYDKPSENGLSRKERHEASTYQFCTFIVAYSKCLTSPPAPRRRIGPIELYEARAMRTLCAKRMMGLQVKENFQSESTRFKRSKQFPGEFWEMNLGLGPISF